MGIIIPKILDDVEIAENIENIIKSDIWFFLMNF